MFKKWVVQHSSGTPTSRGPTVIYSTSGWENFQAAPISEYHRVGSLGFLTASGVESLNRKGLHTTYDVVARAMVEVGSLGTREQVENRFTAWLSTLVGGNAPVSAARGMIDRIESLFPGWLDGDARE